ncbi:MFS transporter [Ornithinibacillus scapharcae]|uniref:MFS transporter n=1 Tax=Ornithinibacillus scapharcae TaxID=1147159 RepID=UPI001300C280|nr:MFS transporter [Ornithinibacillus scapharcae]
MGIGISNIGEWIYLLSLNITVLNMTDNKLAVSLLYIIVPLATIATNFWGGSLIDRMNKRKLLISLDFIRAGLIVLLPFIPNLMYIYIIVFFINMASSIFSSTSIVYMTKLIPQQDRKSFNTLHSLVTSGAFFTGPAIAGILFIIWDSNTAIYFNAIALCISGVIMLFMPDLEESLEVSPYDRMSLQLLRKDWSSVIQFSKRNRFIIIVYILFQGVLLILASAVDSLEVAFSTEVLGLSESKYGFLVSISGVGIIVGSILNVLVFKRLCVGFLIGVSTIFVSAGYVVYGFSNDFVQAAIGFFILAFFTAPANSGFLTFYQNSVSVDMMGRISSIYQFVSSVYIVFLTVLLGIIAEVISIKIAVHIGTVLMFCVSLILCWTLHKKFDLNVNSGE